MHVTLTHFALIVIGAIAHWLWSTLRRPRYGPYIAPRAELPPATTRARRHSIADVSHAIERGQRADGWMPPSIDEFDQEVTHV